MAIVGTPTHGIIGIPITEITGNGTTTPWTTGAGIYAFQVYGTFDTASVKIQWELFEDAGFLDMPNTSGPHTSAAIEGRIQLYHGSRIQIDISSVGAGTDLSVVLRGPRSSE